jgi:hypothetical protein
LWGLPAVQPQNMAVNAITRPNQGTWLSPPNQSQGGNN